ncbi:MAG: hypothetical protein ACXAC2_09415, partial [Candidatus Kariarchaeaceae archaeon]
SPTIQILNTAPTVTNITITSSPRTDEDLDASWMFQDVDGDSASVIINLTWYKDGIHQSSLNNMSVVPFSLTSKGETWHYLLQVYDGEIFSVLYNSSISGAFTVILNSVPVASNLIIQNPNPYTTDDLESVWTYYDADGDIQSGIINITWYNNGILVPLYNNVSNLPAIATVKGEQWNYILQVYDGQNFSLAQNSSLITIINSIPVISSTPTFNKTTDIKTTDNIEINYVYSDADNDTNILANVSVVWLLFGFENVAKENQTILFASETTKGQYWTYRIQVFDGETYSIVYSSSIIQIENSAPKVQGALVITPTTPTPGDSLILSYIWDDDDSGDFERDTEIRWYKNNVLQNFDDSLVVEGVYIIKGDIWNVTVRVSDGTNYGNLIFQSVFVGNSIPEIVTSNINQIIATTSSSLFVNSSFSEEITFYDDDSDPIIWFEFKWYVDGVENPTFYNQTSIPANATLKDQNWMFSIQIYDGSDYSILYNSTSLIIQNTPPVATDYGINIIRPLVDDDIIVSWIYADTDLDPQSSQYLIIWERNGEPVPSLANETTLPAIYTSTSEVWRVNFRVYDGTSYSTEYTLGPFVIHDLNLELLDKPFDFLLEDKDIRINTSLIGDLSAISDYDLTILFLRDGMVYSTVHNVSIGEIVTLSSLYTEPGELWSVEINPFDGANHVSIKSSIFVIESIPKINSFGIHYQNDVEGHFVIWSNVTDLRNFNSLDVKYRVYANNTLIGSFSSDLNTSTLSQWIADYTMDQNQFETYFNTSLRIEILVESKESGGIAISNSISFDVLIEDKVAPRVVGDPIYTLDNADNPQNITFYVNVEEFGLGIDYVTLYYSFGPVSEGEQSLPATGNSYLRFKNQEFSQMGNSYNSIPMVLLNRTSEYYTYTISVPITLQEDTLVLFYFGLADLSNNSDPNAFFQKGTDPNRPGAVLTFPGFSIDEILPYIVLIIIVVIIFSFIINKKFRSKELVGLDVEAVMENIKKLKKSDEVLMKELDVHTLGVVISFFDQRHGPIPVLFTPEMLRDNYNKLLELSDVSFSTGRFVNDFQQEVQSNFDFEIGDGLHINALSYSFSLNRPNARGGAENIVLNILIYKDVFPLISHFSNEIAPIISNIHKTLDNDPDAKENVMKDLVELRKLITLIILSHIDLYGTIETDVDDFLSGY